jgi:glycosyltransferase involved in cell wall biosynthesis
MTSPMFSMIVPCRDRPEALNELLDALDAQQGAPDFEVVIVDDGSRPPISGLRETSYALRVVHQIPLGISAARNNGIRHAKGEILLFVDSDCAPEADALAQLAATARNHPEDLAFQLGLVSGDTTLVQRLECLRLEAIQSLTTSADGHVGFTNTSGFALRRAWLGDAPAFDTAHLRGEDSGLLMRLAAGGSFPRHVPEARVHHRPDLTIMQFIRKHFWIGYRNGLARAEMRASKVELLSNKERGRMFGQIRAAAKRKRWGPSHLFFLICCYANERLGRVMHDLVGLRRARVALGPIGIDPVRERDLMARILQAAERNQPLTVAGVDTATFKRAKSDAAFAAELNAKDLLYAADDSIRRKLWWTRRMRTHTIQFERVLPELLLEAERRGTSLDLPQPKSAVPRPAAK